MKFKNLDSVQRKKLISNFLILVVIAGIFLTYTTTTLYQDKLGEEAYWQSALEVPQDLMEDVEEFGANATRVTTGTYIENLKEISIKNSNFRVVMLVWFKWKGDPELDMKSNFRFYKGYMNKMEVVKEEYNDEYNYQQVRCDVTITKNYWTRRFPLESHQLRMYIESHYMINDVVLVPDTEQSGMNRGLGIAGFDVTRHETGDFAMRYDNAFGDPEVPGDAKLIASEYVTAMEINRADAGLYVKCFVALVGTMTWVLIALFICTYHYVDPLSMVPAALFGTVANIMVGANLLPDALQTGLIEFVNFWGVMIILTCAITIININRIRKKQEDKDFSKLYGRTMFFTIFTFVLLGNILMPVCAYMF